MAQLFALVSEALAGATTALLSNDVSTALKVVEGDQAIDDLTAEVELLVWERLGKEPVPSATLRHLVGVLLIVPELERSGDLAEHIAQRAASNLGADMSPLAEASCSAWPRSPSRCGGRPLTPTATVPPMRRLCQRTTRRSTSSTTG